MQIHALYQSLNSVSARHTPPTEMYCTFTIRISSHSNDFWVHFVCVCAFVCHYSSLYVCSGWHHLDGPRGDRVIQCLYSFVIWHWHIFQTHLNYPLSYCFIVGLNFTLELVGSVAKSKRKTNHWNQIEINHGRKKRSFQFCKLFAFGALYQIGGKKQSWINLYFDY